MISVVRALVLLFVTACGRIGFDHFDDMPPDCALLLRMDELAWSGVAGEVLDTCGVANNGTATVATTVDDPVRGRVGVFGPGACIEIADQLELAAVGGLTLSAWAFPVDARVTGGIVSKRRAYKTQSEYSMFLAGRAITIDVANDAERAGSDAVIVDGGWVQITAVFDGNAPSAARTQLYVDGRLETTLPEADRTIAPSLAPLHVGCLPNDPAPLGVVEWFDGRLDDVAVWTRALSPIEVAAWYAQTR